jgi:hypothetical protein
MAFAIQKQKQSLWCWAAVSASIDGYFSPGASQKQCEIASTVLGRTDCCGTPAACNEAALLQDALGAVERLRQTIGRRLSFEEIEQQVDARYPVCARIGWYGGGGHFVVVSGYSISPSGKRYVSVQDPWYLSSWVRYEDFCTAYLFQGEWTGSYLVKP